LGRRRTDTETTAVPGTELLLERDRPFGFATLEIVMLVLSRKVGEQVLIGDNIMVTVTEIRGGKVRLGFEAPDDVQICRPDAVNKTPRERQRRRVPT
jgi:carbon storage regulator